MDEAIRADAGLAVLAPTRGNLPAQRSWLHAQRAGPSVLASSFSARPMKSIQVAGRGQLWPSSAYAPYSGSTPALAAASPERRPCSSRTRLAALPHAANDR